MNCRLCTVPIDESNRCEAHVLPRGLLKAMSPEEFGTLLIVGTDMGKKKRAPTGSYDQDILCRKCDNKLGVYDNYALNFINTSKLVDHPTGVGWTISNVDHKKLKLFCMSYLWRASITERKEFNGVSLGNKHEERIRQLLLAGDAGSPDDYTVTFAKFNSLDDSAAGVLFPALTRIKGLNHYEAYLPKLYKFWVKVDSRTNESFSRVSLGATQDLFVHNKGDFDTSVEKSIMIRAAKNSQ
ncbi:hypothetical protein A3E76_02600 [Candidatus Saccharibacteria bacterium RIFCSPHIGHO2_12_FULL_44_22]|nr:MAG: hypothetical protein A3E76_02600 [Candidatus Saccharibacteria bacterium RIFCSPHIGHO2_12_FULL_44_22]